MRGVVQEQQGQMAVALAVLLPAVLVSALIIWNLARFIGACTLFDRTAKDIVLAQGVSPAGEETELSRLDAAQGALAQAFGSWKDCDVAIAQEPAQEGSALVRFRCTLTYHPWPQELVIAGVDARTPLALTHEVEIASGTWRSGVVV